MTCEILRIAAVDIAPLPLVLADSESIKLELTGPAGAGYGGTSATSQTIGLGSKTFTVEAGLAWQSGNAVRVTSGSAFMEGPITAYTGRVISLDVTAIAGAGAYDDWVLGPAGGGAGAGNVTLAAYTVASLPAASAAHRMIIVTDEVGGSVPAFNDGTNWRRVTDRAIVSAALSGTPTPLFIFIGESNSGGVGNNADATPTELAARSQVQIWHNTANVFQDLDIGTNNLISHAGATDNAFHGWELQLANAVAASRFTQAQVYLVKCGQGGSRIVEWSVGHGSGYWSTALSRIQAAKTAMVSAGKTPVPIVFFSLGINDAIGNSTYGTVAPPTSDWPAWRTDVEGLISRLRTELGATTPVLMTKFEAPLTVRANVNTQLDAIDAADAYAVAVSSSGAPSQGDGNHWTYAGYKLMTERMIDGGLALLGNAAATAPGVTPASGTYAGAQTVTITAPSALRTLYTDDGSDPLIGTVYSAPFSETPPKTVKAVAIETGKPSSTQVQRDYAASGGGGTTWNPSAAGTYISLLTSNTVASSTTTSTFTSVRGTSGKSSGKYYFEVVADTAPDSNDVIVGIQTAETAGGSGMDNFNPTSTYVHRYDGGFASGIFTSLGYGGYGSLTAGDVIQVAVDATAGKVWIGRNNTFWTGDPAAGTGGAATWTPGPVIYPAVAIYNTAARLRLVPSSTTYTPPSGFTVWG